jgi:hypothetical protein
MFMKIAIHPRSHRQHKALWPSVLTWGNISVDSPISLLIGICCCAARDIVLNAYML